MGIFFNLVLCGTILGRVPGIRNCKGWPNSQLLIHSFSFLAISGSTAAQYNKEASVVPAEGSVFLKYLVQCESYMKGKKEFWIRFLFGELSLLAFFSTRRIVRCTISYK